MRGDTPSWRRSRTLAVLLLSIGAVGCGGADGATSPPVLVCPNDTPTSCPQPPATYAADVAPILQSRCGGCHTPGGLEPSRLFQTWAQASAQAQDLLLQIHTCRMPPAGQAPLTPSERQSVLGWIVCGAMNN